MQNVQNAAEIQQRVINLVELYRNKISKDSKAAKDLAEEYKNQYDNEIDIAYSLHEQGIEGYVLDIKIPKDAVDSIRANEQLIGYFYKKVAQDSADKEVLDYFLEDKFDSSIFTDDDESFLVSHFVEMVNYIIQTPNNNLSAVEGDDRNDLYLLPTEVLDIIKERVAMPTGAKIYNPFTGFAQLACIYKDCSFLCEESYMPYFVRWNAYCKKLRETEHIVEHEVNDYKKLNAWMKVALYANGVDVSVIVNGSVPQQYDAVMSYIPYIPSEIPTNSQLRTVYEPSDSDMINKIMMSYQNLAEGGKMVLVLPTKYLWEKVILSSEGKTSYALELGALWKQMVDDKSFVEIIQLPSVMGKSFYDEEHSIIIAEKGRHDDNISLTDARFASLKTDGELFKQALDVNVLHSMVDNGGMDPNTGLRKYVQLRTELVDPDLLVPQVYVIEKPAEYENPVPLTESCSLVTSHVYDVQENLPEDTPWVTSDDLSESFHGTLNIAALDVAACPNNPKGWSYGNRRLNNMFMGKNHYSEKDIRISIYRNCKYIDGKNDAILFKMSKDGISVAVIEATGKGIAISPNIHVLLPNAKMDTLSLTALLKTPVVYRQIAVFEKFGLYGSYGHLKNVLIPTNKRIIGDERHRILLEQKTLKDKDEKLATQKTEYINEVRMRKHDMGQYIFELVNIEDLMRYYIKNRDTEKDFCQEIENLLDNFRSSLGELSTLLDNLSKEEQFGNPEDFDINDFLSSLEKRHIKDNYRIEYSCDLQSIRLFNEKKQQAELDAINDQMIEAELEQQAELDAINDQMIEAELEQQAELDAIYDQMIEAELEQQAELDAINDQMIEAELEQQAELDAINDQMIEAELEQQAELDAINDQMIEAELEQQAELDDINDQMIEAELEQQAELDAINDQMIEAELEQQAELDAINDQMIEAEMEQQAKLEELQTLSSLVRPDNSSVNLSVPTMSVAPNDLQRAVNNIIDNARKHGFTDSSRKDYELKVRLSIDNEKNMFQIDFINNGTPLPVGMNKMRFGLKGEKAGKTGGTGLGGNYVKSFVEYYHGDYDIFTEDGWTVVRISLPIK